MTSTASPAGVIGLDDQKGASEVLQRRPYQSPQAIAAAFSGQVPWTFNVIEGVERIAALGARAMNHARATRPDSASRPWLDRLGFQIFWNAPVLILISGELEDCCRAAQNLMLSAHARGLGSCWVGSPLLWLRTKEVKAALQIPDALTPNVAMCLGYANAVPSALERDRSPIIWVA